MLSKTPPSEKFLGSINSDLAFMGTYVFQGATTGTRSGTRESEPAPTETAYFCPASQSDVSVYRNLLFVPERASPDGSTAERRCPGHRQQGRVFAASASSTSVTLPLPRTWGTCRPVAGRTRHSVLSIPRMRKRLCVHRGFGRGPVAQRAGGIV